MAQKRSASNPPPGPGQPSSRRRAPRAKATNEVLGVAGSPSAAGSSSMGSAAPARVTGSGARVGSSVKGSSATLVNRSGSGLKGGGKSVSASGSSTRRLSGSSGKAQVGAGPSRAARPIPIGAVGGSGEGATNEDSDEDSDEDEVDWEDVDLGPQAISVFLSSGLNEDSKPAPLSLTLGGKGKKPARAVRKITPIERRIRWETHKLHLLCLLHHVSLRNRWCNSPEVQGNLSPLVKSGIRQLLIGDPRDQPYRRSRLFLEGLEVLSELWVEKFRVRRAGLSRCRWAGPENFIHKGGDPPMGYREFVVLSQFCKGSRDIGAQFFCAMLRSIGVTCRLVCSLQALPFTFSRHEPPMKNLTDATGGSDRGIGYISKTWLQNCRQNDYGTRWDEPDCPVYWVEAWSVGGQKWIAVDPFATKTVGKPSTIEPQRPMLGNSMSYVVAFEDDGDCTDVTRRYAHAFITKTRKVRVTVTSAGEIWWDKVMAILATGAHPDRRRIEQLELTNKTLHEPVPKTLKDLKGHPLYVLERHLKCDEFLKVLRRRGTLTTGFGKNQKAEPIYHREDVIKLRSLENWIRLGRTVRPEEESKPTKYVKAVRLPSTKIRNARSGIVEPEKTGLYAESQTDLYVPEPLIDGRLVKNKFGNIDLFVESMLPAGAAHLPQKNVDKAARLVGVDFAPAITNFEYRSGRAYPVATGIIVAGAHKEAIEAVHEGLVEAQNEKAARDRDVKALRMWRRFITKIRILDHVSRIPEEQENSHPMTMVASNETKAVEKGVVEVVEADEEEFGGFRGGFYSVSEESEPPIIRKRAKNPLSSRQRRKNLRASPSSASTKTTAKKAAKSKSTTTKARPIARKPRGRKAIPESDEEEEAEESEASDSSSSGAQHHNRSSRNFNYKYNFGADSSGDDTDASGSGGFLRRQESGVAPRRSARLNTAARKATPVKYTLDEDDDEGDDGDELELGSANQQQEEEEGLRNQMEGAGGGFLIESNDPHSELSDAPSDLLSDAEYEASIGSKAIESNPALKQEDRGSGEFSTEALEEQDDEGGDGDNEDEGDDYSEPRGVVDVLETPHDIRNGVDLEKTDYAMRGAGPIAGCGTAGADKNLADASDDDRNGNGTAVGKSLPVGNEAAGAEVVGAADVLPDTMAETEMHHGGQAPGSDGSGSMLSKDPSGKDNLDLDWCN